MMWCAAMVKWSHQVLSLYDEECCNGKMVTPVAGCHFLLCLVFMTHSPTEAALS
jgi:hypothetical protein